MVTAERVTELEKWVLDIHQQACLDDREVDIDNAADLLQILREYKQTKAGGLADGTVSEKSRPGSTPGAHQSEAPGSLSAEYREIAVTAIRRFILLKDLGPSSALREGLENIIDEIREGPHSTEQTRAGDKHPVNLDPGGPERPGVAAPNVPGSLSAEDEHLMHDLMYAIASCPRPNCTIPKELTAHLRRRLSEKPAAVRVRRKEVKEWAKTMTNAADHYKSLTSDQFIALVEANENYLRSKLEEKGIVVEDKER